jgi:hypothetical protein
MTMTLPCSCAQFISLVTGLIGGREKNREREKPAGCMVLESDRAAARKALESDEWNSRIATV